MKLKRMGKFFSIIASIFCIISCEVGLGSSVDTVPPTVTITYPPESSIIRDYFILSGKTEDDKEVKTVKVVVKSVINNVVTEISSHEVKPEKNIWKLELNKKNENGEYPLLDGKYTVDVISTDTSGRVSGISSRTFEIDNTAPVFVIKSPGITNIDAATAYGSIFKVVGTIADDHEIARMTVKISDDAGNNLVEWTEENVDTAGGTEVIFARYNRNANLGEDVLNDRYLQIYGNDTVGDKSFFCTISVADKAGVWQTPENSEADAEGNTTDGLYLNDDVHEILMGNFSKYKLTASDFKKILNGTYFSNLSKGTQLQENLNDEINQNKVVITESQMEEIKSILSENFTNTSEKSLAFKLNKNANPTYNIIGFSFLGTQIEENKASKNGTVSLSALAGLDGTFFNPKTIKVYLFGPYNSITEEQLNLIYKNPTEYYNDSIENAKQALGENASEELIIASSRAKIIHDGSDYIGQTVDKYSIPVQLPDVITLSEKYVFAVSGNDVDGLDFINDGYYGFVGDSAGFAPTITVSNVVSDSLMKDIPLVKGTVESGESKISNVTYKITVIDEGNNSQEVGTITGSAEAVDGSFDSQSELYSVDITSGMQSVNDGYTTCLPVDGCMYKYDVYIKSADINGLESAASINFKIDNKKPEISIASVLPVVSTEETASEVTYIVNGTITISVNVMEANYSSAFLTVSDGTKSETSEFKTTYFTKEIDTTSFADLNNISISIKAIDKAENEYTIENNQYKINQSTDIPLISANAKTSTELEGKWDNIKNGQNLFNVKQNNSISFNITDDDSVDTVEVTIYKSDETTKVFSEIYKAEGNNNTSFPVTLKLPSEFGDYKISVFAKDIKYTEATKANRSSSSDYYISVNESNLSLKINEGSKIEVRENQSATITGVASVSLDQIESLKKYELSYNLGNTSWEIPENAVEIAKYPYDAQSDAGKTAITVVEKSGICEWTDNYDSQIFQGSSEKHYGYVVIDRFGNEAQSDLQINIDNQVPTIKSISDSSNWKDTRTQTIQVVIGDNAGVFNSGIDSVTCKINNLETEYTLVEDKLCDVNGNVSQNGSYRIYKTTLDLPSDGVSTVKVYVKDKVGYTNSTSITYMVDTVAPIENVLSIEANQVLNQNQQIVVNYSSKDSTSGIRSIKINNKNNFNSIASIPLGTDEKEYSGEEGFSLYGMSDGEYKIYMQAEDLAGNKTDIIESANSFTVDNTSPSVKITSPISDVTVNKNIEFKGTVADANISQSALPTLQYSSDGSTWNNISGTAASFDGQSWAISGVDTTAIYNDVSSKAVKFKVSFTDKAGNLGISAEHVLTINQNTDRPEIKLTNIPIISGAISSNKVMGVIADDDGDVSKLYRIDSGSYTTGLIPNGTNAWKEISVEKGTGIWTAELANNENQGEKSWYFYVIDASGNEFCTKNTSQLGRMYLSDSANSKLDNTAGISFFYDVTPPAIDIVVAHGTSSSVSAWDDINNIFGGESYIWIKAIITEEVGMASTNPVAISVKGASPVIKTTSVNGNVYEYTFTPIQAKTLEEGTIQISVTAKDSAGQENKNMTNVIIDKTAPTVKIITPTTVLSDAVSSAISIKGLVQDNYSSIQRLEYAIPETNGDLAWKDVGTAASWEIKFASGAPDSSDSLVYYANAKDAGGEFVYAIVPEGTENIYKVPVHFRATDSCGNVGIITDQYVLVDSDGGKPKVWINSPEDGATTSGVVTIYGGASDNVSVSKVCLQIDANNDGVFDSTDFDILSTWPNYDIEGLVAASGSNDWYIEASGTNSWKRSINTTNIPSVAGKTYLRVRVRAIDDEAQTRDWSAPVVVTIDSETPTIKNLKLVQYGNGVSLTKNSVPITEREYITGMYISNFSVASNGNWYLIGDVEDNSSISSVTFTKIESSVTNNINLNVSNITDVIDEDGLTSGVQFKLQIPLKTDSSGVISYAIKATDENGAESSSIITINIDSTAPSLYTTNNSESLNVGTNLRLKSLGKVLGTNESNEKVVNNNNYFTFGDVVSENGSGLAYLAFYFERQGSSGNRIYNPMFGTDNKTVLSSKSSTNGATYINDDGLAVMYVSDNSRSSEDSITVAQVNENIRVGGLIKIAGGYSRITEVVGTTVKFNPTASENFTTAEIVLAQVVDHQIIESFDDNNNVMNDDGDEMVETIQLIGSSYNWSASVNSRNIPDGPITVNVVAIDNAGNISKGTIATKVENNRPRIAKVLLATDLNGNGTYDWNAESAPITTGNSDKDTRDGKAFGEFSYYSALNVNSGKAQSEVTLDSSTFKVISGLCVVPEFIGGNTSLGYILEYPTNLANATKKTGSVTAMTTKSNIAAKVSKLGEYSISDEISDFGGLLISSPTSGNVSITFWDRTEETTQGTDSQWALLKIPVSLLTSETDKPEPKVNPFYWNSKTDNSVYSEDGVLQGHIELESDLTSEIISSLGNDPKISGKIKVEGIVYDNVRLASITINAFGNSGTVGTYSQGTWKQAATLPSGIVSFAAEDLELSQSGHYVKYTVVLNTEVISTAAAKDKVISIGATDWKSNACAAVTSGIQTVYGTDKEINGRSYKIGTTNFYKVDVVPYVTSIWTDLSEYNRDVPSVYARSSVGNYPVGIGEEVTIYGYNLNYTSHSVKLNGTAVSGTSVVQNTNDAVKDGTYGISMNITDSYSSGKLEVFVNGIAALNNKNANNAIGSYNGDITDKDASGKEYGNCYNRQPNGINNNVLTDDIGIDVWNFKSAAEPEGSSAKYVHMKVGPYISGDSNSGRIGFSFKNGIGYYNMPGNARAVAGEVVKLRIPTSFTTYTHIHLWNDSTSFTTWPGLKISEWNKEDGYYVYTIDASSLKYKMNNNGSGGTDKTEITSSGIWTYNGSSFTRTGSITSNVSATTVFSQTRMGTNFGGFTSNSFTFDSKGQTYGVAMCPDTSGKAGIAANLQFFSRATGSNSTTNSQDLNFNYLNVNNARRIENICYYKDGVLKTDEERIQVPSMASYVNGTTSYVYLAYYDHGLDQIKFRIGSVGSDANDIGMGLQDLNKLTTGVGGSEDTGKIGVACSVFDSTSSSYVGNKGNAYKSVKVISTGNNASADVAVGALNNGTAVVAYYAGNKLNIRYAAFANISSANAYLENSWSGPIAISTKGGKNVAMAIDADNGLHFAYSSNSGADLYYTYMESINDTTPTTVLVDSYDNVGSYCTIDVGRSTTTSEWIPYITYKRDATEAALKIATPVEFTNEVPSAGASSTGYFTGAWDICTIPSDNNSINDLINVGLCKDWSTGEIKNFPAGTDDFSYNPGGTYAICNSSVVYGNQTKNPVVGYAVENGHIELAQKK